MFCCLEVLLILACICFISSPFTFTPQPNPPLILNPLWSSLQLLLKPAGLRKWGCLVDAWLWQPWIPIYNPWTLHYVTQVLPNIYCLSPFPDLATCNTRCSGEIKEFIHCDGLRQQPGKYFLVQQSCVSYLKISEQHHLLNHLLKWHQLKRTSTKRKNIKVWEKSKQKS